MERELASLRAIKDSNSKYLLTTDNDFNPVYFCTHIACGVIEKAYLLYAIIIIAGDKIREGLR